MPITVRTAMPAMTTSTSRIRMRRPRGLSARRSKNGHKMMAMIPRMGSTTPMFLGTYLSISCRNTKYQCALTCRGVFIGSAGSSSPTGHRLPRTPTARTIAINPIVTHASVLMWVGKKGIVLSLSVISVMSALRAGLQRPGDSLAPDHQEVAHQEQEDDGG